MQDLQSLWARAVADLGWVDLSALTVLAFFFLLGLVKGMVWQIGRAVALLGSYGLAVGFGPQLAGHVFAAAPPSLPQVYLAYVVVFLAALMLLSAAMRLVQSLVQRAGLGVFDRLGGALLGVGTGSVVVIGLLSIVLMFGQRFPAYASVQRSHTIDLGRSALAVMGDLVPPPVQAAFAPPPTARVATRPLRADTPALDHALEQAARER